MPSAHGSNEAVDQLTPSRGSIDHICVVYFLKGNAGKCTSDVTPSEGGIAKGNASIVNGYTERILDVCLDLGFCSSGGG